MNNSRPRRDEEDPEPFGLRYIGKTFDLIIIIASFFIFPILWIFSKLAGVMKGRRGK